VFFLLVFNKLRGVFPTFASGKKLSLRALFLFGFFMGVFLAPQDAVRAYFTVFGRVFAGGGGMLFGCRPFLENGYVRDSGDGYTSSPFSHEKAFAFL